MTGLHTLDSSIQKTNDWVNDVAASLHLSDRQRALAVLRSGLHALRDRLPINSSAHLAAQLPVVLRGLYFEGWRPSDVPTKVRDKQDFLALLQNEIQSGPDGLERPPEDVARATFGAVVRHVSPGEARKVRDSLPAPIRELWPEC